MCRYENAQSSVYAREKIARHTQEALRRAMTCSLAASAPRRTAPLAASKSVLHSAHTARLLVANEWPCYVFCIRTVSSAAHIVPLGLIQVCLLALATVSLPALGCLSRLLRNIKARESLRKALLRPFVLRLYRRNR